MNKYILIILIISISCGKKENTKSSLRSSIEPKSCRSPREIVDRGFITGAKESFVSYPVYQESMQVLSGDVILINANSEFTNDLEYNVMVARYVTAEINGSSYVVGDKSATNITPGMHHYIDSYAIMDKVETSGTITYTYYAYFAAHQMQSENQAFQVSI